jgi:hypothetical protein
MMEMKFMTVTPQQAREWMAQQWVLKHRPPSHIRHRVVDGIASAIRNDGWVESHQAIAFDTKQQLVDGEHRLLAIIRANKVVSLWVCFGLEAQEDYSVDEDDEHTEALALTG